MTKILKRLSAVVLAAVVAVTSGTTAFALTDPSTLPGYGKTDVSTDKAFTYDESIADTSFATQAACAAYYANVITTNGYDIGNSGAGTWGYPGDSRTINVSNVGDFYGYVDASVLPVSPNQVTSQLSIQSNSKASVVYGFSLENTKNTPSSSDPYMYYYPGTTKNSDLIQYTYYGLMLKQLGFDSVGSTGSDTERKMYGFVIDTAFSATNIVSVFFKGGFKLLKALNPFQFFETAYGGNDVLSEIAGGASDAIEAQTTTDADGNTAVVADASRDAGLSFLQNARTTMSAIFKSFLSFAWAFAIPLSILLLIAGIFLSRNGIRTAGSKIKQVLIKCMFLVVGIPLLGASYTQILNNLSTVTYNADDFIVEAVSKTFVDFESWVKSCRLDPSAATSDNANILSLRCSQYDFAVNPNVWAELRTLCSTVNKKAAGLTISGSSSLIESPSNTLIVGNWYNEPDTVNVNASKDTAKALIQNYYNGRMYTAATFADSTLTALKNEVSSASTRKYDVSLAMAASSFVNAFFPESEYDVRNLVNTGDGTNAKTYLVNMLKASGIIGDDNSSLSKVVYGGYLAQTRFGGTVDGKATWLGVGNIWDNGALKCTNITAADDKYSRGYSYTGNTANIQTGGFQDVSKPAGLSSMAMYNYLCTDFTENGLTVGYGAPSEYTAISHYSVNLIGANGLMRFAFAANLVTICFGYFFLAFFFVFRTLFETIFKGFELIAQALLSALGFYKSMGRCICITINMVVQLLLTTIFFAVVVDIMFGIAALFDSVFTDVVLKALGGKTTSGMIPTNTMQVLIIVGNLASSLVIIFYVSFMNRWRTAIVSSINSLVEECVGTLMGVNLQGASGMGNIVAGALQDTKTIATGAAAVGAATGVMSTMADGASNLASIGTSEFAEAQQVAGDDSGVNLLKTPDGAGLAGVEKDVSQTDLDNFDKGEEIRRYGADFEGPIPPLEDGEYMDIDPETGDRVVRRMPEPEKSVNPAANTFAQWKEAKDGKGADGTGDEGTGDESGEKAPTSAKDLLGEAGEKVSDDTETLPRSDADDGEEPETGMHFDAATMGVVYTKKNNDGSYSDIGLGLGGVTLGGTKADGTKSSTTLSRNGIKSTQENEDGETITSEASLDGMNSGMTTTKTDADGNVITTTTNAQGTTKTLTERGEDGSVKTTTIGPDGTITVDTENAVTGYKSHRVSNEDGSDVTLTEEFPDGTVKTTRNNADIASVSTTTTDENGNERTVTDTLDKSSNLTTHVESNGTTQVEQVLDEKGEVVSTTQRVNNSDGGYSVLTTDADGNQTVKTYNAAGNVVDSQTAATEHVEVEKINGKECEIHYGSNGDILYTVTEDGNGNGIVQNYQGGKAVGQAAAVTGFEAGDTGSMEVVALSNGREQEVHYNSDGEIAYTITEDGKGGGIVQNYQNGKPSGETTTIGNFDAGKQDTQSVITLSDGREQEIHYNSNGEIAYTITEDGKGGGIIQGYQGGSRETVSNFDADMNRGDYTSNVITLGDGSTREMRSYVNKPDVSEMILTETDGSKRVVTQSSDSVNTVTYSASGDKTGEFTIDDKGRTTGFTYSSTGAKTGTIEIDENGEGSYVSYNSNGAVAGKAVIKRDSVVYTDEAGQQSTVSIVSGQPTVLPNGMVINEDATGNRTFSSGGTTFTANTDKNTVNSSFISAAGDSFNVAKNGSTGETTFKTMTDDGATTETTYNKQHKVVNLVLVDEVGAVSSQSIDANGYVTRSTSDVIGNTVVESYGANGAYNSHVTYAMGGESIKSGTINSDGKFTGTTQTTDTSGNEVIANIVNNNIQNISGDIGGNSFKGVGGDNGVINIKAADEQGLYSREVVVNVAGGEGTEGNEPAIKTQPAMFSQFTNQAGNNALSSESLYAYILGSMGTGDKIDTNSQSIDISSLGAGQGEFGENFFDNHGSATDDNVLPRSGGGGGRRR